MPHSFIQAALDGDNNFIKYVISLILIFLATVFLGAIPAAIFFSYSDDPTAAFEMRFADAGVSDALGLALVLLPFVFGLATTLFTIKYIHERRIFSVVNPTSKINYKKILFGAGLWFALQVVFEGIAYQIEPSNYEWTFDAMRFFPVLIVVLLIIPLQTSFEEVLFRGYLMQGLGLAFRYPWIALVFTSVVFGAMHMANPEIETYGTWLIWSYIQIGLVMGILTLMDEGLELALGLHAMHNIYASIFVTFPSSALATPALFTLKEMDAEMMYLYSTIAQVIFLVVCALVYKWTDFNRLFRKIQWNNPLNEEMNIKDEEDLILDVFEDETEW